MERVNLHRQRLVFAVTQHLDVHAQRAKASVDGGLDRRPHGLDRPQHVSLLRLDCGALSADNLRRRLQVADQLRGLGDQRRGVGRGRLVGAFYVVVAVRTSGEAHGAE